MSDDDLERLRGDLYALADIAITAFLERRKANVAGNPQQTINRQEGETRSDNE